MRNHETGEYEIVIGNPQLLTAFGIVVLLCAAAFIMGYEVGQNTPHAAKAEAQSAQPVSSPAAGAVTQPPAAAQTGAPPASDAGAAQPQASEAAPPTEAPPEPTTQAARETPVPAAPAPPPAAEPAPAPQVAAMPPGSYCQAMAVRQASDARALLETLKDGGMPASLQNGSDGWVRVMVGPYQDRADLSRAKTELETRFQIRGPICK